MKILICWLFGHKWKKEVVNHTTHFPYMEYTTTICKCSRCGKIKL